MALGADFRLDLSLTPSIVETGAAKYPIAYVRLVSNSTGEPVLAPSNLGVELLSSDASIAFVPSRVVIPSGSDYAQFEIEVGDLAGETEISAQYGNQQASRTFRVVDTTNPAEDVDLVINPASDKMQVLSEMPFSVFLENNGSILQAPQDITVKFNYEHSLMQLGSDALVIKKGSYYAIGTIKTLEKSGNAFIKAAAQSGDAGKLLNTVINIQISQTLPVSLKVNVFPDKVGLNEHTIDIFVGVVDAAGQPTLAAQDTELDLFSSAYQLTGISDTPAIIKKGEFGFYTRQYMNFYNSQMVTVGASASGLGASTASFEVLEDSLDTSHPKAVDKALKVFTVGNMPSEAESIVVYQLNAIERDCDDLDFDGEFPCDQDTNNDGEINDEDHMAIDDLVDGELYPIESVSIFSQSQGNLNIVSGDNLAAKVVNPGSIASGSSYGTATISSGRQADSVEFSASLANVAVASNAISITGGLNPTQTKIFSPAGVASDGKYRVLFDRSGYTDLFLLTLDPAGRPSNSEQGVKYLIKPVNELTEINPGTSFASLRVNSDSLKTGNMVEENKIEEIGAVPVGVNADSSLEKTSAMHLLFHTGTTSKILLAFNSTVAFSQAHPIGIVQLRDVSGNPVLAPDDFVIKLSSSSPSGVLPASVVTIPKGKSFASFSVATFGRADNFTIYGTADGLQSSSAILTPILVELPASFIGPSKFSSSVPTEMTVSTPIQGASIEWGTSSTLQLVGDATNFKSVGNSYTSTTQVLSDSPGTFTVDATVLKDGFKPTRISKEVVVGLFQKEMRAVLVDNGMTKLAYNQPASMQVSVVDANGMPIPDVEVQVEDTGPQGLMLVSTLTTDSSGTASFVYTPIKTGESDLLTIMVTGYKDGYQPSRDSKVFEADESIAVLPAIPVIGGAFVGLPSWAGYVVLGGIVAVGSGLYMLKKPKDPEENEPLVEELETTEDVTEEAPAKTIEDTIEDEEEEGT